MRKALHCHINVSFTSEIIFRKRHSQLFRDLVDEKGQALLSCFKIESNRRCENVYKLYGYCSYCFQEHLEKVTCGISENIKEMLTKLTSGKSVEFKKLQGK